MNEARYILDGLLMNNTGRNIKEQYADTGGFTALVLAAPSLLSYRFIQHIRGLPSKRLYLVDPTSAPEELRGLIGGKVREVLVLQHWPDVLRTVAAMAAGTMPHSQLLNKFASYPRQYELALALREIGRIERTLFIIKWLLDADMQRRAQIGLNKDEAHHALKNCPTHRPTERNPRPHRRGAAIPHGRADPACRDHHLLEHKASRARHNSQKSRRSGLLTTAPVAYLAPRMGTYPAHG